jgi:hypothetical protein
MGLQMSVVKRFSNPTAHVSEPFLPISCFSAEILDTISLPSAILSLAEGSVDECSSCRSLEMDETMLVRMTGHRLTTVV